MRYLLLPFRWTDEKVQNVVDRAAFRLMDHLRCERRVLSLMLSLLAIAFFVPIAVAAVAKNETLLGKTTFALFLGCGGWHMLNMHAAVDRPTHHWRHYILARVIVATMKVLIVFGIILWMITGAPHAELTTPMSASLFMGALSLLGAIYLQRTPLSRPVRKAETSEPAPQSAPADS